MTAYQFLRVGNKCSNKDISGTIVAVEWSISFETWCYQVKSDKGKTFWIYQDDETLRSPVLRFGRIPKPPEPGPPPISVPE